jgi:hypothetical protein
MTVEALGGAQKVIIGKIEIPCSPEVQLGHPEFFSHNVTKYHIKGGDVKYVVNNYTTDDDNCPII